uniref:FERM domain-containing protein n=1 Tax=Hippocampus comes TaxID=109280 RepID=A0A3Q2Z5X1_HIPCM
MHFLPLCLHSQCSLVLFFLFFFYSLHQGNSLLFLPNVLKVYLENGQTKAFKFDHTTTVKDIVLTLKDKLSIRAIEYFALVLEQQYSITKLLLLHEDELIQKVVQKKDSHDYRCLFRVCFIPRDPTDMQQEDAFAFEYLFLQVRNEQLLLGSSS